MFIFLLHITVFEESHYISLLLATIIAFVLYIIKTDKVKDIFKAILFINGLILSQLLVFDFELDHISLFVYTPYLILIPALTRNIIKKYSTSYKMFEYIGYILVNLIALQNYTDELDGMIFVFALTFIVIISYIVKFGPVFLISLLSILINILLLTRTFWLGLPWWLYILVIGALLIGFAIYNELNEKKNDMKLIVKLKDKLDL